MGADFIYALACVDETKDEWINRVSNMTLDDVKEMYSDGEWLFIEAGDEEDDKKFQQMIVDRIIDAINICYEISDGRSREADILRLNGHRYVITAGLSYGDSPTDVFDDISTFNAVQEWWEFHNSKEKEHA